MLIYGAVCPCIHYKAFPLACGIHPPTCHTVVIPNDACAPVRLAQTLQLAATVQRFLAAGEEVIVGGRLCGAVTDTLR